MNPVIKFFHQLRNPHCPDCASDLEQELYDPAVEVLKEQCARLQIENDRLLNKIIDLTNPPKNEAPEPQVDFKPINPLSHNSWKVRRQMLEEQDKRKADEFKKLSENYALKSDQSDQSDRIKELESVVLCSSDEEGFK